MKPSHLVPVVLAAGVALGTAQTAFADAIDDAFRIRGASNVSSAQSQQRIDKLADQTQELLGKYRGVVQQLDSLRVYNAQLEKLVGSQEAEKESLQRQIDGVTTVEREIMPLMDEMVGVLGRFVEVDVPFLLDERRERVEKLQELMLRADVTVAEKYRALIEAFQIENNFGHTIEAYQSKLDVGGEEISADFLRVGRVALFYQTLDGARSGMWTRNGNGAGGWQEIDDGYNSAVKLGLRIARKQAPPDLLLLPVPTPEETAQ